MIGIDEVGRGCWAGPLLIVAARMTIDLPVGLADSKILSKKKRESLFHDILLSCDIGEGWVTPAEIDAVGLTTAMRLGVERALESIGASGDEQIIMDGNFNYCPEQYKNVSCVIDADATYPIVSAASIYAKVSRDNYMALQAEHYPLYGFEKHVGYGTKVHSDALKLHGLCDLHRLSFKPIQPYIVRPA